MKVLFGRHYKNMNNQDEIMITNECSFEPKTLMNTTNALIQGGNFGAETLLNSERIKIYNGNFGNNCLANAKNVTVYGGNFGDCCFMNAEKITLLGGNFGKKTFYNARFVRGYTNGEIKSITNLSDSQLVIRKIEGLEYEHEYIDLMKTIEIFARETKEQIQNHLMKIDDKLFDELYSPDSESLDERIDKLVKKVKKERKEYLIKKIENGRNNFFD